MTPLGWPGHKTSTQSINQNLLCLLPHFILIGLFTGEIVYVIGHAIFGADLDLSPTVTIGIVSKVNKIAKIPVLIQVSWLNIDSWHIQSYGLTLSILGKISADDSLKYFSQKRGFDISCKLSPKTICIKGHILFSGKRDKISICHLLN